jgi:disulfide bond formation protein DsbB
LSDKRRLSARGYSAVMRVQDIDANQGDIDRPGAGGVDPAPDGAWGWVFGCWLVASASTLGALFFSEIMGIAPCVLCWYQRIAMFPLVVLLPLGLFPFDPRIVRYAWPLAAAGWLVALYHLLVAAGVIPESMQPCTQGVPCAEESIRWLGFVTIPLLSFVAFTIMNMLLLAAHNRSAR